MSTLNRIRYKIAKTPLRTLVVWARHRGLRPGDVFLGTYPRSGSTWTKFMLFESLSGESADFIVANAAIPPVGLQHKAYPLLPGGNRVIKTHEPFHSVYYHKAVYLVRDVRDIVLSEYAFHQWRGVVSEEFEDFLITFLEGKSHGYGFGSWAAHVNSWLEGRGMPGKEVLVVRYEDLRQNPQQELAKIIDFFGVRMETEKIKNAVHNNSLARMRDKEDKTLRTRARGLNYLQGLRFVRKGSTGGWRQILSDEQVQLIERYAGETLVRVGYPVGQAARS